MSDTSTFDPGPGWREHLGGMVTDPNIVYRDGAIWRCWVMGVRDRARLRRIEKRLGLHGDGRDGSS